MDGEEGITGRQAGEEEAGRQAADIDALSIILPLPSNLLIYVS